MLFEKLKLKILALKYRRYCPLCNIRMTVIFSNDKYVTCECPQCHSFLQIPKKK